MKIFWILFLMLFSLNNYSQVTEQTDIHNVLLKQIALSQMKDGENQVINLDETKGSPYFKDIFSSGMVFAESTNESLGYQLRYNIFSDEIEVQNSDDNTIVGLKKHSNYSCKILDDSFKYIEYTNKNNRSTGGYFHVLSEGKTTLLVKYECKYQPEKEGKPPVYKVTPAKFIREKSYFLLHDDQLTLISTKKKKFLENFGEYKGQVNSYISKNKLNTNKDRDLIRMITFYNSLLE